MNLGELLNAFDFTESDFLGMEMEHGTRSLCLLLDYYWQLGQKEKAIGQSQPLQIVFHRCRLVSVQNEAGYANSEAVDGGPQTVISWGDARDVARHRQLTEDISDREDAVTFQLSGPGGDARILVICQGIQVEPWELHGDSSTHL